jgi:hypothetical protein
MKRVVIWALLLLAVWYGWKHYPELLHRRPQHEIVIKNASRGKIERLRVGVGDQTFVKETLDNGATVTFPFQINEDAKIDLLWEWSGRLEGRWSGRRIAHGPLVQRHFLSIDRDGGVTYRAENKKSNP